MPEPVTGLAYRAHHLPGCRRACAQTHRLDAHPGLVQGRAHEVVHRSVDDAEILALAGLEVEHLGQHHAGVAHQRAAGLQQHFAMAMAACVHARQHARDQILRTRRCLVGVGDAQAAAEIDVRELDADRFDRFDEIKQTVQRIEVGLDLRDLRADVAVDAHHVDARQACGMLVRGQSLFMRDAELVAFEPGGDVRVRAGVDIRVDAQAHRRAARLGLRHVR